MAHLSGYSGTVTFAGPEGVTEWAPDQGDVVGAQAVKLTAWTLHQETDNFEALSKGQSAYTRFATISRWSGTATFLLQDGIFEANNTQIELRETGTTAAKNADITLVTGGITLDGDAYATGFEVSNPMDGPVECTFTFVGKGALAST